MITNGGKRFGDRVDAKGVTALLHMQRGVTSGMGWPPLCIWGDHGIGKTQLVEGFARQQGLALVVLAPAQFEEMGDLLGMPAITGENTVLRPPSWVPQPGSQGILLLDDFNRADQRILRGLMPLLERGSLVSWALPAGWQIVLTANPDQGDYAVTPLDPAMLTRMAHVTMVFSPAAWAAWAVQAQVLPLGIEFVLHHPELVGTGRTTARTLTQFFNAFQALTPTESRDWALVRTVASAFIDEHAAAVWLDFLRSGGRHLPSALDVLNATNFTGEISGPLQQLIGQAEVLRVDLLVSLQRRMLVHLAQTPLEHAQQANLAAFVAWPHWPADLRLSLLRGLSDLQQPAIDQVLANASL